MTWSFSNSGPYLALAAALQASPAGTGETLSLPVDCDMDRVCSIQKYVDRRPGPGREDYRCGTLTTDEHKGIDIRTRRESRYLDGIAVLAAAPGRVLRVRDGMPDVSVRAAGAGAVAGREAGNSVIVVHAAGLETQYSHLRRGSIRVKPGDIVARGQPIGAIGLSGSTEYPHLHFEVRRGGTAVDPFAPAPGQPCGAEAAGLWSADARRRMPYRATQLLDAGFALAPEAVVLARAEGPPDRAPADAPALLIWGVVAGVQAGDVQQFRIMSPNGEVIHKRDSVVSKSSLDWVGYSGLSRKEQPWKKGRYTGYYRLIRNGFLIGEQAATVTLL